MKTKKRILLAAIIIVMVAVAALLVLRPPLAPDEPLPSPNGYDFFVKGAAMLSDKTGDWNTLSIDDLRALMATNAAALEIIRTGLTNESRVVPYSFSESDGNATYFDVLATFKNGANALCAASRFALLESRTNDAARMAVECIRFGQESTRGGVLIDALVGIAIEALGRARLEEALPGMDAATAREIATALEEIASRHEPLPIIWQREARWARQGRLGPTSVLTPFLQPFLQRKEKIRMEQKLQQAAVSLHRTNLRAAMHAYELERGKPPTTARDLVPNYLKSVPLDPVTGQEMPLN